MLDQWPYLVLNDLFSPLIMAKDGGCDFGQDSTDNDDEVDRVEPLDSIEL